MSTAQETFGYTVSVSWQPSVPTRMDFPVYPVKMAPVTGSDAVTIAHRLGAPTLLAAPEQGADGSVVATVQLDGILYTLTVSPGYGTPSFTLHAADAGVGTLTDTAVTSQASVWLQAHHLQYPGLYLRAAHDGVVDYGEVVSGGVPVLGPTVLHLFFDARGRLRDLSSRYVAVQTPVPWPAQSSDQAVSDAMENGQGFFQGPASASITGTATFAGVTLAYVGVHDSAGADDYLEPVYAATGNVLTTSGAQPFTLYASALQYAPTPPRDTATLTASATSTAPLTPTASAATTTFSTPTAPVTATAPPALTPAPTIASTP